MDKRTGLVVNNRDAMMENRVIEREIGKARDREDNAGTGVGSSSILYTILVNICIANTDPI